MNDRWKMLWTCWLLPAGLGVAAAGAFATLRPPAAVLPAVNPEREPQEQRLDAGEMKHALPEGQQPMRLAALAGRTTEARQEAERALAAGADDQTLAYLLSAILVSEPEYLETFLKDVPEKRRGELAVTALLGLAGLQPDGMWHLLQRSPALLALFQEKGNESLNFYREKLAAALSSPLGAQMLLDPAMGFTQEQAAAAWMGRDSPVLRESAVSVLEEWRAGRWPVDDGESGDCLRKMWQFLHRQDPAALQDLVKTLPPELSEQARKFSTYAQLIEQSRTLGSEIPPQDLALLGAAEIRDLSKARAGAGQPIPLAVLAGLPPEQRGLALANYVPDLMEMRRDLATEVAGLDSLPLEPSEKEAFLLKASSYVWTYSFDAPTALEWLMRLPEGEARNKQLNEVLAGFGQINPQGALAYAEKMPPGPDRQALEEAAKVSLP